MTTKKGDAKADQKKLSDMTNTITTTKEQATAGHPEITEEQKEGARKWIENQRETAILGVPFQSMVDFVEPGLLTVEDIAEYRKKRVKDYLDSVEKICVANPNMIAINQEMLKEYEEELEKLNEGDEYYNQFRGNRLATINQIITLKGDIDNRKENLQVYIRVLKELNVMMESFKQ